MRTTYEEITPYRISIIESRVRIERLQGFQRHCEEGPAVIWHYDNGSFRSEMWYRSGKLHRYTDPAVIKYCYGDVYPGADNKGWVHLKRRGSLSGANWYIGGRPKATYP